MCIKGQKVDGVECFRAWKKGIFGVCALPYLSIIIIIPLFIIFTILIKKTLIDPLCQQDSDPVWPGEARD